MALGIAIRFSSVVLFQLWEVLGAGRQSSQIFKTCECLSGYWDDCRPLPSILGAALPNRPNAGFGSFLQRAFATKWKQMSSRSWFQITTFLRHREDLVAYVPNSEPTIIVHSGGGRTETFAFTFLHSLLQIT